MKSNKIKLIIVLSLIKLCHGQIDGMFWWVAGDEKEGAEAKTTTSVDKNSDSKYSSVKHLDIVCCECVPFYMCVDGVIISDGTGLIDVRIGGNQPTTPPPTVNVDICPGELDICCQIPDPDPICLNGDQQPNSTSSTQPPQTEYSAPHPESNCECLPYNSCHPDLVVSNGLGTTSIELSNGRKVNHSKCTHSLDVCCFLPDLDLLGNFTEETSSTAAPTEMGNDEICECVPSYLCTPDGYIRTDGESLIDVRLGPSKPLEMCPHDPNQVCCKPPASALNETKGVTKPEIRLPLPTKCGRRNSDGIGVRILGFQEGQTQFGEFPWVASILRKDNILQDEYMVFAGGASLIHPRVVLTAAHKLKEIPWSSMVVRLGEWDTASQKESLPHQDIGVEEVVFHPNYVPATLFHDVALVILKEEAREEFHITEICPAKSLDEVIGSSCVVNGWGVENFTIENYQRIVKSVTLPLVGKKKCQELLRKTRLSKYFNLHQSFICAGGEEGLDACKGDGGGPLSCPSKEDPNYYLQVGITAWGIGCGTKDVPGVYVDVTEHYDWIMSEVESHFPLPSSSPSLDYTEITEDPAIGGKGKGKGKGKGRRRGQNRNKERRRNQRAERRRNRRRNRLNANRDANQGDQPFA